MVRFLLIQTLLATLLGSAGLAALLAADLFGLGALVLGSPDRSTFLPAIWLGALGPFTAAYLGTAMAFGCWNR